MKWCKRCKTDKPLDCFTKDSQTKDGLRRWCRECRAEYDAARNRRPGIRRRTNERLAAYKKTPKGKAWIDRKRRNYRKRHPEKIRARSAVQIAVRSGELVYTGKCQACGAEGYTEFHHPDYSRPLDVQELCDSCNKMAS